MCKQQELTQIFQKQTWHTGMQSLFYSSQQEQMDQNKVLQQVSSIICSGRTSLQNRKKVARQFYKYKLVSTVLYFLLTDAQHPPHIIYVFFLSQFVVSLIFNSGYVVYVSFWICSVLNIPFNILLSVMFHTLVIEILYILQHYFIPAFYLIRHVPI